MSKANLFMSQFTQEPITALPDAAKVIATVPEMLARVREYRPK